ncbi:MAG TPA: hypothetical protein VNI77_03955 [Nitrososphaera sp.]|nr:hypothetical protein [Nitrososphaera sp.]
MRRRSLPVKRQSVIIGSIAAVSFLLMTILSFGGDLFSVNEIPFFFRNGQEIAVRGTFEDCVSTKLLAICYPGFRSDDGVYFVLVYPDTDD